MARAIGLSFAAFRYFNAAGAAADGSIGEDHDPETHLIPLVFDAATGRRENIQIFGTDYPTPDGTCLRDYVHVDDLSRAHIAVFDKLDEPGRRAFLQSGNGNANHVREVIAAVEKVTGKTVPIVESPRRAGDPPALYADATKASERIGWTCNLSSIEPIVESAWKWHQAHPNGYED